MIFTNKLDRSYGNYVKDIRSNIERGTGLWLFIKLYNNFNYKN